jgi:ABC-type lipoprotein export system ATPase subunit
VLNHDDLLYQCKDIFYNYKLGEQSIEAIRNVSIDIKYGEFLSLAGPSGSGKTTLLNLLGLIEKSKRGEILFSTNNINKCDEKELNKIRRFEIGFIFQNFHLIDSLDAYENVEYFLLRQNVSKKLRQEIVENALTDVGLWEQRHQRPLELSGGQKQRVAIARAIAKRPKVIIGDEPTASLDQKTGLEIMNLLRKLNKKDGITIVLASHDPMVLEQVDRVVKIYDGKVGELS